MAFWNKDEMTEEQEKKVNEKFKSFKDKEYSQKDADKVLDNEEKIMGMMKNKTLAGFVEEVKLFFSLIKDFCTSKYKDVSIGTIVTLVGTLIYVVSPIDVIPDVIPGLGLVDDAGLLGMTIKFLADELKKYKEWKEDNLA